MADTFREMRCCLATSRLVKYEPKADNREIVYSEQ
jgi:hypothetical protein